MRGDKCKGENEEDIACERDESLWRKNGGHGARRGERMKGVKQGGSQGGWERESL